LLTPNVILYISGAVLALLGSFWIIGIASREAAGWKYTVALIPLVNIVYGLVRWSRCKVPLLMMTLGIVLLVVGALLMTYHPDIADSGDDAPATQSAE
jgi:hypothetical protein